MVTELEARTESLQQLIPKYHELPGYLQQLLQLLSAIYEPAAKSKLLDCLHRLDLRDGNNKRFTKDTLKSSLDRLSQDELVLQQRTGAVRCHPQIAEVATRDAVRAGQFDRLVEVVEAVFPIPTIRDDHRLYDNEQQLIRNLRISIYRQDLASFFQQMDNDNLIHLMGIDLLAILENIFNAPFDREWFSTLSPEIFELGMTGILADAVMKLAPVGAAVELLEEVCRSQQEPGRLCTLLVEQLLFRDRLDEAATFIAKIPKDLPFLEDYYRGWLAFFQGDNTGAIAYYEASLKELKKYSGKRKTFFSGNGGLFFIFALMKTGSPKRWQEALGYTLIMKEYTSHPLRGTYEYLELVIKFQQGDLRAREAIGNLDFLPTVEDPLSLETFIGALSIYWTNPDLAQQELPGIIEPLYERAETTGYHWLSEQIGELFLRLRLSSSTLESSQVYQEFGTSNALVHLMRPQAAWEVSLNALTRLNEGFKSSTQSDKAKRLAWFVTHYSAKNWMIQPREQKIGAKGDWSKGRPVALRRLHKNPEQFDYLTPQDLNICAQMETFYNGYGGSEYKLGERAALYLIDHPTVFWEDNPNVRVEVVKGEPQLWVKQGEGNNLILELSPPPPDKNNILAIKETPTRLQVVEFTAAHRRIAEILGEKNQLKIPVAAKERVLEAIDAVAGMVTVQSDISGSIASAREVPPDSKPHFHLLPVGEGLRAMALVRPFMAGPYFPPGEGSAMSIAEVDGERLQTTRHLEREKELTDAAIAACPTLSGQPKSEGEWQIEAPEDCLEVLLELQALGEAIIVEWPQGEKFRVSQQAGSDRFRMSIQQERGWFAIDGELALDNEMVLNMQQLLELLATTPSRFIPIGDGEFLALTRAFRQRLDELRTFGDSRKDKIRLHPLAAVAMKEFADEVGELESDRHWQEQIQRFEEVQNLDPQVPTMLQAELRDYQIEGFKWLVRLAHWGVGACLADDMGLGKTLQALAVILTQAEKGGTLVIAPTSVCGNWESEAQKFAPSLNVIQLGNRSDRASVLDNIQPFDLVLCSYGLLQQEEVAEYLAKVEWQIIVLDEAQAIKNAQTKRSQAAMALQGAFKLIMTAEGGQRRHRLLKAVYR